ncbi:hypothetical protein JCM19294_1142 [Nonlabens tegetincola]|uniref:Uncharacterized protein n=1 Tax=Nonlabens tegetincola TaxID=323273 RepID=A0A090Q515_9FLAO|nr:hypothetical protein [Nonlabens tegetincola]GAK96833.1 hypothetical protein JCM19294_1142 [Nonlabens tegetincola]
MYDLSGGALGYDVATDTIGTSQLSEYIGVVDSHADFWQTTFNRELSAGSYRNGVQGSKDVSLPYYLGSKNSDSSQVGDADTYYGLNLGYNGTSLTGRDYFKSYPLSTRWLNAFRNFGYTQTEATTYLQAEIAKTIVNGGWFRDFAHYHDYRNSGYMEKLDEFFQACKSAFGSNNVHTCSNGEALEYMYLRDACNRVVAKDDGTNVYLVADFDTTTDFPLEQINIPLSVKVDLTGTSLENKSITSSDGKVINLGSNQWIVPVIFRKSLNIQTVKLYESNIGIYNTSQPIITTSLNGSVLTVSADQPSKMVVYEVDAGGFEYDALPVARFNDFRLSNNYTVTAGKDYYIGVINEYGSMSFQSI